VSPGSRSLFTLSVFNAGDTVEEFEAAIVGIESQWFNATPARLSLLPGATGTFQAHLTIPADAPLQAGTSTIGFQVRSVGNPSISRVEEAQLVVEGTHQTTMTVEPRTVRGGGKGAFTARLQNTGTLPAAYTFRGDDPEQAVSFTFEPPSVTVAPHGQAVTRVKMTAKRPWSGSDMQRIVTVNGDGPKPVTAQATFIQRPRIGRGAGRFLATGAGIAALAIALAIPAVRNGVRDLFRDEPSIEEEGIDQGVGGSAAAVDVAEALVILQFAPTGPLDASGCTTLAWSVQGADSVTLATPRDGTVSGDAEGQRQVCGNAGDIATLTAVGGGGSDSRTYQFSPDLAITGDVEISLNGANPVFSMATNQVADVELKFAGQTVSSNGALAHALELEGLPAGTGGTWSVTATAGNQAPITVTGDYVVPFLFATVALEGDIEFESNQPPPTTSGDIAPATIAIDPGFVLNPLIFEFASWNYAYTTAPKAGYLGPNTCPNFATGDPAPEVVVPVEDPSQPLQIGFGGGVCLGILIAGDPGPLPDSLDDALETISLEPTQEQGTFDVEIETGTGELRFRVTITRMMSDTAPPGL
jgi:hypothetical protein